MKLKVLFMISILFGCLSLSLVLKSAEKKDWNNVQSTEVRDKDGEREKTLDLGEEYIGGYNDGEVTVIVDEPRAHEIKDVNCSYENKAEGWKKQGSNNGDIIIYTFSKYAKEAEENQSRISGKVIIKGNPKKGSENIKPYQWGFGVTSIYNFINCKNYYWDNNNVPWIPDTKYLIPYISSGSPFRKKKVPIPTSYLTTWTDIRRAMYDNIIIVKFPTKVDSTGRVVETKDVKAHGIFQPPSITRTRTRIKNVYVTCDSCQRKNSCNIATYRFDYNFSDAYIMILDFDIPSTVIVGGKTENEIQKYQGFVIGHELKHREIFLNMILEVIKPSELKYVRCRNCEGDGDLQGVLEEIAKKHGDALVDAIIKRNSADSILDGLDAGRGDVFFITNPPAYEVFIHQ